MKWSLVGVIDIDISYNVLQDYKIILNQLILPN